MNFIELRAEKTSQWEIQEYAKELQKLMFDIYPKTTQIWSELYW
jgi:thymidylate synthase ThyX